MLDFLHVHIDWYLAAGLGAAAGIDLLFRYLAFKRLESFAIDIALFNGFYCVIEYARDHSSVWAQRSIICGSCLLAMIVAHTVLSERLGVLVKHVVRTQSRASSINPPIANIDLDTLTALIERSVLVTFSGPETPETLRDGKRTWRTEAAAIVNGLYPTEPPLSPDAFLFSRRTRFIYGAGFGFAGVLAFVAPFLEFELGM